MTIKSRVNAVVSALKTLYPVAECSLQHSRPHELLFATILSAQCTDKRVNATTPELFNAYPSLQSFAEANETSIANIIRPCGFFNTKAKHLKQCAVRLLSAYGGVVPDDIDELVTLSGVGRKTANLIVGEVYGKAAIVADTHCIRLSNRIGLAESLSPAAVERVLKELIPPAEQLGLCHRFVAHGREVCLARSPKCAVCGVGEYCIKRI